VRSLGLGLHIVRQIALAHGEDVEVHSNAKEGTHFIVHWPCCLA
jgi:sigma-B regulation protein RsbU (phosphoserine phosphatase)